MEARTNKMALFNLSGHDHFDMSACDAYLSATLIDSDLSEGSTEKSMGRHRNPGNENET
jgi:hypothetical protein